LTDKIVSEACYSATDPIANRTSLCPNGQNSQVGAGSAAAPNNLLDGFDHGTHVAGIAARVAPQADLIAVQVNARLTDVGSQTPCASSGQRSPCVLSRYSDIILGLQRVFALRTTYTIAAANLSLGSGTYPMSCNNDPVQTPMRLQIDLLRAYGIATVISAGNGSQRQALGAPACLTAAISVGNITTNNTAGGVANQVAPDSNASQYLTLFAPGTPINSAVPGATVNCGLGRLPDADGRCFMGGTSMAAPHVAGALAVLRSADPAATVSELVDALTSPSAPLVTDQRAGGVVTKPRLDLYAALCRLIVCDLNDFRLLLPGSTLTGHLQVANDNFDVYFLNGLAGQRLTLSMNRLTFNLDPVITVLRPDGALLAYNNNGGGGVNARINVMILPVTGRYRIIASRTSNATIGQYEISLATAPTGQNPAPFVFALAPGSATVGSAGFWVEIHGSNFISTSQPRLNGSNRIMSPISSDRLKMWVLSSDMTTTGQRTITVHNPGPGGGASTGIVFNVTSAFNGESALLAPAVPTTTVGVTTTFAYSWTHPTASWRNMQNLDFRLVDEGLNSPFWLRLTEGNPTSTVTLLSPSGTPIISGTLVSGQYGAPADLVVSDTVTLHLGETRFFGSGQTIVITPVVTFGPAAVGNYDLRFAVDDDAELSAVQHGDVLGRFTVLPLGCQAAVTAVSLAGPVSGTVGALHAFTATLAPPEASLPVTYTWTPEPASGQSTPYAEYAWTEAGQPVVSLRAENCAGFAAEIHPVDVYTTEAPDLALSKSGPATALTGDPITYTLTVTNHGAAEATGLLLTDVLPAGAAYLDGGTLAGDTLSWALPSLAGYGASTQVTFTVSATGTITNVAYAAVADGGHIAVGEMPVTTEIVEAQARLTPLAEGALSYADPAGGVALTVAGGAVFAETVVAYRHLPAPTQAVPGSYGYAGRAFRLDGYQDNQWLPALALADAVTLTVAYDDADAVGLDEARLGLFAWLDGQWSDAGLVCQPDPAANQVVCVAPALPLAEMMLAEPPHRVYLAMLVR
jgi:uncharacterized repeat protein (TIGR01451 family)